MHGRRNQPGDGAGGGRCCAERLLRGGVCGDGRIWATEWDSGRRSLGYDERWRQLDDECYGECESERICDFFGRDGFVRYERQDGVCRDHGIQHSGAPRVACVENNERGRELDRLERDGSDGIAGRSGERVAGGFHGHSLSDLCGNRRGSFCEFDERAELDGSWSGAGAGGVGISSGRAGDDAADV